MGEKKAHCIANSVERAHQGKQRDWEKGEEGPGSITSCLSPPKYTSARAALRQERGKGELVIWGGRGSCVNLREKENYKKKDIYLCASTGEEAETRNYGEDNVFKIWKAFLHWGQGDSYVSKNLRATRKRGREKRAQDAFGGMEDSSSQLRARSWTLGSLALARADRDIRGGVSAPERGIKNLFLGRGIRGPKKKERIPVHPAGNNRKEVWTQNELYCETKRGNWTQDRKEKGGDKRSGKKNWEYPPASAKHPTGCHLEKRGSDGLTSATKRGWYAK